MISFTQHLAESELPVTYLPVSSAEFYEVLHAAGEASPIIKAAITWHPRDAYDVMRCYLSTDRKSGYTIKPTTIDIEPYSVLELANVFSLVPKRGSDLVDDAIVNGAEYLDVFEGKPEQLYRSKGFEEFKREPNWTPGGPDVVYLIRRPNQ